MNTNHARSSANSYPMGAFAMSKKSAETSPRSCSKCKAVGGEPCTRQVKVARFTYVTRVRHRIHKERKETP
jgi:hypothetical protein